MSSTLPLRRIFVVGCPRSGTTIVQAILASFPGVMSMGETDYFQRLLGYFDYALREDPRVRRKWRRRLAFARGQTHGDLQRCLQKAFGPTGNVPQLHRRWSGRGYITQFLNLLDETASQRGCVTWVEKTPDHMAYIDVIAQYAPDAHFLHILRHGEDVLTSIVDGQTRFSEHKLFAGSIPYWVDRWNRTAAMHLAWAGKQRHTVLPYECLFTASEEVRQLLRELSGTPSADSHPTGDSSIADLDAEPWKKGATDGVLRPPVRKFEKMFGPELQSRLSAQLTDYGQVIAELVRRQPGMPWVASAAGGIPAAADKASS